MLNVMITGGRHYQRSSAVASMLRRLYNQSAGSLAVFVGDCPSGADLFARRWCAAAGVPCRVFDADWASFGYKAGPVRNWALASACAASPGSHLCVAFPGGAGTASAVSCAARAGLPVRRVSAR